MFDFSSNPPAIRRIHFSALRNESSPILRERFVIAFSRDDVQRWNLLRESRGNSGKVNSGKNVIIARQNRRKKNLFTPVSLNPSSQTLPLFSQTTVPTAWTSTAPTSPPPDGPCRCWSSARKDITWGSSSRYLSTADHFDLSRRTRPAGHYPIISVPVTLLASSNTCYRSALRKPRSLPSNEFETTKFRQLGFLQGNERRKYRCIFYSRKWEQVSPLSLCSFNSHRISTTLASSVAQPPSTLKQEQRRLGDDQCLH